MSPATTIPESFQSTTRVMWKRFEDEVELAVHCYLPTENAPDDGFPSIIFFHGGMWMKNNAKELIPWALHFVNRGIACFIPEYRTREHFDLLGEDILQDGCDFWLWLRDRSEQLGIAPDKITVAGADAGALMALHVAMPPRPRRPLLPWKKRAPMPIMPAAVAVFRGVVDSEAPEAQILQISYETRNPERFNPAKRLRKHLPPLFCAHGDLDPLQDMEASEWFCDEWKHAGNASEYYHAVRVDHTLMSFSVNPLHFELMTRCWEDFMVKQKIWQYRGDEKPLII